MSRRASLKDLRALTDRARAVKLRPMRELPTYSFLTKLLDVRHAIVLRDWLRFLTVRPTEMLIYGPGNPEIQTQCEALSAEFSLPCKFLQSAPEDDLRQRETAVLKRMVQASRCEYVFMCNLDTLPFRRGPGEERWMEEVFELLEGDDNLAFFSACGLKYRDDKAEPGGRYFLTQRFSNNCGLLRRDHWIEEIEARPQETLQGGAERFHSEWALEEGYRLQNRWGLRRRDTMDWRVFHVQRWDATLLETRELFLRGVDVERFLNRVHEDNIHPWERIYNFPAPSPIKLLRIRLGKWRRELIRKQRA
jgi:hypothetical protein